MRDNQRVKGERMLWFYFNQGYTLGFKKTLKSVIEIIAKKININVILV